jgi:hypothetical protein
MVIYINITVINVCDDNIKSNTRNTPEIKCSDEDVLYEYNCVDINNSTYCSYGCGYYLGYGNKCDTRYTENNVENGIACIKY